MNLFLGDIHLWGIPPGYEAMSAHVMLMANCSWEQVRRLVAGRSGVARTAIHLEGEDTGLYRGTFAWQPGKLPRCILTT